MNENNVNVSANGGNININNSALGINNKLVQSSSVSREDGDVEDALASIAACVEKSNNYAAKLLMNEFVQEMNAKKKDKGKLRQLWKGLSSALPDVAKLVDACAKVSTLFL